MMRFPIGRIVIAKKITPAMSMSPNIVLGESDMYVRTDIMARVVATDGASTYGRFVRMPLARFARTTTIRVAKATVSSIIPFC